MNKVSRYLLLSTILLTGCSCTGGPVQGPVLKPGEQDKEETVSYRWEFDDAEGWAYAHQDTATIKQWSLQNGNLVLSTRANTRDRSKMYTLQNDFIDGSYTWRINVPNVAAGDQASIAGFIYQDDHHELDFEIGYGSKAAREEYGINPGEMVACMTNQDFPFSSTYTPIKPGWHTFTIQLEVKNGFYVAHWIIDETECKVLNLDFDTLDAQFRIMCSVENLLFIGDNIPANDYSAKFDYVEFVGHRDYSYTAPKTDADLKFAVSGLDCMKAGEDVAFFDIQSIHRFTVSSDAKHIEGKAMDAGPYSALYPYDENASLNGTLVSTTVPSSTVASQNSADVYMLAAATETDGAFAFKNVMSAVSFTLANDLAGVKEVVLETMAGESLVGAASLDCLQKDPVVVSGAKQMSIKPADGSAFEAGKKYYASVVPGSFKRGFRITVKKDDSDYVKEFSAVNALKAGEVKDFGTLTAEQSYKETRWDFDKNIDGWYYYTHNPDQSRQCYEIVDGCVKIWTEANTMHRNKLHTYAKNFTDGDYEFRVYVSRVAKGEKCSIGAFIYSDDKHELDFEIGYGKESARTSCGAKDDEMVACMTNQGGPFNSTYTPISVGWHTCILRLEEISGKYKASWLIDGEIIKTLNLNFGKETKFLISVSVENLEFMGDFQPTHENYGLFDYVVYRQKTN